MVNPIAGPAVLQAMSGFGASMADSELMSGNGMQKMMASFPIGRLLSFPGVPVTREQIVQLIVAANAGDAKG